MHPDDQTRLHHMLDAAREALSFIEGKTQTEFEEDRQSALACVYCIQIIGEAANRLTPLCRDGIALPWPQIIGMRHRLVHSYYEINMPRVWDTLQLDLPPFIAALEAALRQP